MSVGQELHVYQSLGHQTRGLLPEWWFGPCHLPPWRFNYLSLCGVFREWLLWWGPEMVELIISVKCYFPSIGEDLEVLSRRHLQLSMSRAVLRVWIKGENSWHQGCKQWMKGDLSQPGHLLSPGVLSTGGGLRASSKLPFSEWYEGRIDVVDVTTVAILYLSLLIVFFLCTDKKNIVRGLLIAITNAQTAPSMYNVEISRLSNEAYTIGLVVC